MTADEIQQNDAEGERFDFFVSEGESGGRLDRYLAERPELVAAHLSRSRIKALIEEGRVTLRGAAINDPAKKLSAGDSVTLDVPPPAPAEPQAEDIALNIVYEDAHLIVIDKPAGLVVHPASGHESGTLVNALIAHCGESLSGVGGVKKPGIVHRIDKDTTGLLVVAKTDAAHHGLSALFADHGRTLSLTREYLAFVWGVPDRAHGTIETYLGRHSIQRERMAVVPESRGREAITHWEKIADYGVASLIRCQLETGRTHQIRVHMSHIGHPLIGDATYGAGFKTKVAKLPEEARTAVERLGRQALHAATLGFEHPITSEEMMFESDLPQDLVALMAALEQI
ncbi:RluA family pseudouridine synthase [Methylocystis sp. MJC1]|jgi:23S rRNA pseudouridine1911/1915/1917 synthase|uniref:RluA family pseudouridine synthase n=1 Tax=Methylocystis sp. MJC1 TaxID=2654282 RepID=UPI0013EAF39B|nr:RluA family pseudouridine synthase [Methylocystis sp. MJC1]KAF2991077.1 Ribosomal large subunit pseudouridine synthase D [Methylocystis sp. MJC1]MBU6526002.1 RluA family pseudouridine synthase [Methylocystis sp. MJC1]UZX12469.1 RluA family pseudouridine synthase [Methylocystis sp. MJC1]